MQNIFTQILIAVLIHQLYLILPAINIGIVFALYIIVGKLNDDNLFLSSD